MDNIFVGHVIRRYLQLTETFIQSYLTHAKTHLPCVLTDIYVPHKDQNTPCVYLATEDEVCAMPKRDRRYFFSQLPYPTCFARTVKERHFQVLHAHFGLWGYRCLALKQKTGLPLVVSFYGVDASRMLQNRRFRRPFAQLFAQVDAVTVLGKDMHRRLLKAGCDAEKIHDVPLGVDCEAIPFFQRTMPADGDDIVLLYCGRLVEKKGILDALEAFAHLKKTIPRLHFRIVGDGILRTQLKDKICALGLKERVTMVGALPHGRVLDEMANAHLFVLPSKTASDGDMEGTPTVLLEAQASGLPVLSTRHADIPACVLDGKSGFLVAEGQVNQLAERLEAMVADPTCWAKMGQVGREHVEAKYAICRSVQKLEKVYHGLV